jgi:hypothetical protein
MDTALTIGAAVVLVVLLAAGLAAALAPPRASRHTDNVAITETGQAEKRIRLKLYGTQEAAATSTLERDDRGQCRR